MPNEEHLAILEQGVDRWNAWRKEAGERPDLQDAVLHQANLHGADLQEANLQDAFLWMIDLSGANLQGTDLHGANLSGADLQEANLRRADLSGTILQEAKLHRSDLSGAKLQGAFLQGANLQDAILREAKLQGAFLQGALLLRTDLQGADLTGARVYGASVWNVHRDDNTQQNDLIITGSDEPTVTVDDLEVAQFVYLLLTNQKIRQVINTVTSKAVLILGRFGEHKPVLDAIHERLREKHDLVPILFDWEPSESRDLTETIVTLAGMCRFVIADLTDAKSIPQELSHIIPQFQSVPIRPIILASQREYAMYEHWKKFDNVLSVFDYTDTEHLLDSLKSGVIDPIEDWEEATDKEAAKQREMAERERRLKAENAKKDRRIAELEAQLASR